MGEEVFRNELGERLYREKEFMTLTGFCRATLHTLRRKGELGYYRIGRSIRYGESHLRALKAQHEKVPRPSARG